MLNVLSPLARLDVLATPRQGGIWYRPDDILRVIPSRGRAMVRLSDGSVVAGTVAQLLASSRLLFARTGSAWAADRSGAVHIFASNQPRITDAGMTIEPAATNSIANSAMQGAVLGILGTGGALPAGWSTSGGTGLTKEIVEIATEDGIPCVTIRFYGTNADNYGTIVFGGISGLLTATPYAASAFIKLVSGSLSVLTSRVLKLRYNLSPSGQTDISSAQLSITSGRLSSNRSSCAAVTAGTLTGTGQFMFVFNNVPGAAIDFTLKFGCPQVEAGLVATSPILTTGSAATRAADDFRCPTSGLLLPASGTLVAEWVSPYARNPCAAATPVGIVASLNDSNPSRFRIVDAEISVKTPYMRIGDGSSESTARYAEGAAAGERVRFACNFSSASADSKISYNGGVAQNIGRRWSAWQTNIGIGCSTGGTQQGTLILSEIALTSSTLANLEVESARYAA